jgi:hypothetical protein
MRLIGAMAVTAALTACSSTPTVQTGEDAEVIGGTLHKVDKSRAQLAYVDPDADLGKYTKILIRPLGVDNIEVIQPPSSRSTSRSSNWEITEKDKAALQKAYRDAMVKQLQERGDYPIVTEPGDDVLEIAATITAIAPAAPRDDSRSRAAGRSTVYTEGAGSIAVTVGYGDSETGEVLGLAKDSRSSGSYWGQNNSVSNMAEVRRIFDSWAIQIRDGLDRVHGEK